MTTPSPSTSHSTPSRPSSPTSPTIPGLPVAILRYRVTNPGPTAAKVGIAFSIENPVNTTKDTATTRGKKPPTGAKTKFRTGQGIAGLVMSNPALAADDPMAGEFVLAARVN